MFYCRKRRYTWLVIVKEIQALREGLLELLGSEPEYIC